MAIWAVGKDPGGRATIFPVVRQLRALGNEVLFFVDRAFKDLIVPEAAGIIAAESASQVLQGHPLPSLLLTSMCTRGGVGRDLVPRLKEKHIPTIAVQDFWGGCLWSDWQDQQFWPDVICVNDKLGAEIVSNAWPKYAIRRINITGYPALDKYAHFDHQKNAAVIRSALRLYTSWPVVLFSGQIKKTGAALQELVAALNKLQQPVYLIACRHPRMQSEASEELGPWEAALAQFRSGTLLRDAGSLAPEDLLSVAHVVVSMYSSVLVEAAALRVQNISILYPQLGMDLLQKIYCSTMNEFPLVAMGCSARAKNRAELCELLEKSFSQDLHQEVAQRKYFPLDGNNARRVAQIVMENLRSE